MDFQNRLQRAIERGQRSKDAEARRAAAEALNEEECKRLHSDYRLNLTEHIEWALRQLADQFPGFQYENVVGERGWGGAIVRDDVSLGRNRKRGNLYSRLEIVVRPYNKYHVLDVAAKGTIRNKESFNRNQFQLLGEAELDTFQEMIDHWVLEYAEDYSASI
jgi:hypothetical protein